MLLEQALQSSDDTMLEGCLAESSEQVVESTVKRMPLTKVVAFLDVLTEKIDETGKIQGLIPHTLKLTPVPGKAKLFHYGSSSTNSSFFLITDDSEKALEVELLE